MITKRKIFYRPIINERRLHLLFYSEYYIPAERFLYQNQIILFFTINCLYLTLIKESFYKTKYKYVEIK